MTRIQLPAPCHLCGQTCVSQRRGRADFGQPAERTDADVYPWRQCPHRPSGHTLPPVIEDQGSHAVVAAASSRTPGAAAFPASTTMSSSFRTR